MDGSRTITAEVRKFWKRLLPEPDSVRRSFGSAIFEYGREMFEAGLVQDLHLVDSRIEGRVRSASRRVFRALWEITPNGRLRLECSCPRFAYCPHQIAIYLGTHAVIKGAQKLERFRISGRPQARRREEAEPHLSLELRAGVLDARAELRSLSSPLAWPVDGRTTSLRSGKEFVFCDARLMGDTFSLLVRSGFEPLETPGHFQMIDLKKMETFFSASLPCWIEQGQVEMDDDLRTLLEGESELRILSQARGDASSGWFEYGWEVEAAGEVLTPEDLSALQDFVGQYFRTRSGKILRLKAGDMQRRLRRLKEIGCDLKGGQSRRIPLHFLARALRLSGENGNGHGSARVSPELDSLYRRLEHFEGIRPVEPPGDLQDSLRSYQKDGLSFLNFLREFGFGGILADEMGLGKTVQALALLELQRRAEGRHPSLVLCPTSVAPNWIEESIRFTPALKAVHLKSSSEVKSCNFKEHDLVVLSYGLARRNRFADFPFRFLILDEAQRIKNPRAVTTREVKSIPARYRLALTGTPLENSVAELWSIFDFLMPGFLGSYHAFRNAYEIEIMCYRNRLQLEELCHIVRPFILRRLKGQVAKELPEKTEQNIYCELTPRQKVLYREMASGVWKEIQQRINTAGWEKSRIHILSALTRLRQLCCHPALWDQKLAKMPSAKMEAFLETLDSILAGGQRVVVFSQFVKMLKILGPELGRREIPYLYLDGATRDRQTLIRRFQEEAGERVFLMSLKAGGTGINLTAASYVVLFDPWWNPAVENQAIDRVHRIGQDQPVTAYRLIARGTIEEKMLELKKRKQDLADSLLATETEVFKVLTKNDLRFLLS